MDPALEAIEAALKAAFSGVVIEYHAKPTAYSVDDPEFRELAVRGADAFVYAAAYSASTTHFAIQYGAMMERAGCPGLILAYDTLVDVALNSVEGACAPARWIAVPYPLTDVPQTSLSEMAARAVERLLVPLTPSELNPATAQKRSTVGAIHVDATHSTAQDWYYHNGCTDGLPIVPPTDALVEAMLNGSSVAPGTVVAENIGPEGLTATVEHVAINAVMAGCTPSAFPIVLAGVEAYAGGPPGNRAMYATQARATSSFAFMQVINGPIAAAAGMNSGLNALGPGNRANATIGRALRLAILNLGGGKVGTNLMPVIGNPAGYTFAFAENEASSPWPSLSVTSGRQSSENVLSFFSGGWSHTGNYIEEGLDRLASDVACFEYPSGLTILISPARARLLATAGWTKEQVEAHVWQQSRRPLRDLRRTTYWPTLIEPNLRGPAEFRRWSVDLLSADDEEVVSVYPRNWVRVVVVGGDVSPMMQAWKMQMGSQVSIDRWM